MKNWNTVLILARNLILVALVIMAGGWSLILLGIEGVDWGGVLVATFTVVAGLLLLSIVATYKIAQIIAGVALVIGVVVAIIAAILDSDNCGELVYTRGDWYCSSELVDRYDYGY